MVLRAWIRSSWMGLSAWTIVYALGRPRAKKKKRSCTQAHSWTPFIHQFMMDHPSYAIILQIHTFNLPKILEKPPFTLPLSTFKSSRKISDLHGMYHSKQGYALCMYIRLLLLLSGYLTGSISQDVKPRWWIVFMCDVRCKVQVLKCVCTSIRAYLYPFVPTRKNWHHTSCWTWA